MRTIRVTGKGQLRLRPDTTRITVTLQGVFPDYEETLRASSEDTEQLRALLAGFGFDRADLKTLDFGVDTEYESRRENDVWKQIFVGYRFRHTLKLEFPSDQERLGRVLYALAHSPVNPELRLSYTVSDPEAAKNELLGRAVADAAAKAETLTRAAGVRLREIQSIDYSWGELRFETEPLNRLLAAECDTAPMAAKRSYDLDIEPDDVDVSDTVTVVWSIE